DSGVVAPTNGNTFFAAWVDHVGQDDIFARSFNSLGNPLTNEVNLTANFNANVLNPSAVRLPIANQADGLAVAFEDCVSNTDHDIFRVRPNRPRAIINFTPFQFRIFWILTRQSRRFQTAKYGSPTLSTSAILEPIGMLTRDASMRTDSL